MKFMMIAALAALCGCSAGATETGFASAYAASPPSAVECDIRVTPTRHGLRFEALALGDDSARGEYEFVLTRSGRSGDSDIVQAGEFELGRGARQVLGQVELNHDRRAAYEARLELRDDEGLICAAEQVR